MKDILHELFYDYILLNTNQYDKIGLFLPVGMILLLLIPTLCAAVIFINARSAATSLLFSQLMRHSATSEESAKTLKELRLADKFMVKLLISSDSRTKSVVSIVGEKKIAENLSDAERREILEKKIDFETAKLYIKPDRLDYAKLASEKNVSSLWKTVAICAAIVLIVGVLFFTMPEILALINASIA